MTFNMCKNINKGFVQISVLLSIIFGVIALCSVTYIAVQKYTESNNDTQKNDSVSQKVELDELRKEMEIIKSGMVKPVAKQVVVSNAPVKTSQTVPPSNVSSNNVPKEELVKVVDKATNNNPEFSVSRVVQAIFRKPGYLTYGGYEITVVVSAINEDIYIPKTTSDSTSGVTGFEYIIGGDDFRGMQTSKVDCSIYEANYCWIQKGKTREVTATVWLTPNESGNYSIKFDSMNFKKGENGKLESFSINKETQRIYLDY